MAFRLDSGFHSRLGGSRWSTSCSSEGGSVFSRCRYARRWAGSCIVLYYPPAFRGTPIYERVRDKSDVRGVPVEITLLPGTKTLCNTFVLAGWNGEDPLHQEPGDGENHSIDLAGAKDASCTSSDGAAPGETGGGGGERNGVQEGGNSCSCEWTPTSAWGL